MKEEGLQNLALIHFYLLNLVTIYHPIWVLLVPLPDFLTVFLTVFLSFVIAFLLRNALIFFQSDPLGSFALSKI